MRVEKEGCPTFDTTASSEMNPWIIAKWMMISFALLGFCLLVIRMLSADAPPYSASEFCLRSLSAELIADFTIGSKQAPRNYIALT